MNYDSYDLCLFKVYQYISLWDFLNKNDLWNMFHWSSRSISAFQDVVKLTMPSENDEVRYAATSGTLELVGSFSEGFPCLFLFGIAWILYVNVLDHSITSRSVAPPQSTKPHDISSSDSRTGPFRPGASCGGGPDHPAAGRFWQKWVEVQMLEGHMRKNDVWCIIYLSVFEFHQVSEYDMSNENQWLWLRSLVEVSRKHND